VLNKEIQKKRPGKQSHKIILLHGNAHPHAAVCKADTDNNGMEIMNNPPYSLDTVWILSTVVAILLHPNRML
jgi:hypothetical protein